MCGKNEGMQNRRINDLGLALMNRNRESYREKRTQILQLKKKICQKVNGESRCIMLHKMEGRKISVKESVGICCRYSRNRKKNVVGDNTISHGHRKAVSAL